MVVNSRTKPIFFGSLGVLLIVLLLQTQRQFFVNTWGWLENSGPGKQVLGLLNSDAFLPTPLRSLGSATGDLTRSGTIEATNDERTKAGLGTLHENAKLDEAAQQKLQDMFDKQYFEHISPTGVGPSNLAQDVGYKYLVVGENLALGNFKDDRDLVTAWMNSPGHRANILHDSFQEIGVAVGKGEFEGKTVWLAVQEFGTPASACPSPDSGAQAGVKEDESLIQNLKSQADQIQQQLNQMNGHSTRDQYNEKVNEYNAVASQINQLISSQKELLRQYNASVEKYNSCLEAKS